MARLEATPELADKGYWYHVETIQVEDLPGSGSGVTIRSPIMPVPNKGYCAWYMSDDTAIVRSPVPLVGVNTISMSTADKLIADGHTMRPKGRVGGK